jgi:hypothetical protein
MKQKSKIYTRANGQLVYECKYIADRASRSMHPPEYDDADTIGYNIELIVFPAVDVVYMVATDTYVGPTNHVHPKHDAIIFKPDNGEGWSGNSDHTIKRYHGWRGTTDGWSLYGEGVRKCIDAYVTGNRSRTVRFVFGKDLKKDQS